MVQIDQSYSNKNNEIWKRTLLNEKLMRDIDFKTNKNLSSVNLKSYFKRNGC